MKKAHIRKRTCSGKDGSGTIDSSSVRNLSAVPYFLLPVLSLLTILASCATTPKLPAPPPRYVYARNEPSQPVPAANSLWRDTASLYEDVKARRLNDLVTINVVESISGSGTADTSAAKKSSMNAGIDTFFGLPINSMSLNGRYGLSPSVKATAQDDFAGNGSTNRAGNLVGTITAKVVEVMPNGTLSLESRKEITINNEKQILILKGIVRPDDIAIDNTVLSSKVADAEVFFVGDGVVQEKQNPGWFTRIMSSVWPF
ncbi:MAG TPA: flagellar basal body L-ring protein FlgH [Nitrospirota bacterium]|nr:flagellar basal body L-ring protein FlgH [Nitrospirota bacterium]